MNIQREIKKILSLCEQKKIHEAKKNLSKILDKFPHQVQALRLLSDIFLSEGNLKDADFVLNKLTTIDNLSEKDFNNLINLKLDLNKPEEAKDLFKKITKYKNLNYFIAYIKTYRMLNKLDEIEDIIRTISYQKFSKDLNLILTLGYTYNYFTKYKKSLDLYEQNKHLFINEPHFLYNYAITLNNNKYYEKAITVLKEIEKKHGTSVEIKKIIAASYMFQSLYEKAIEELNQCKEINPNDFDVDIKKSFILLLQENIESALEGYNKIINDNPNYYPAYLHKSFLKLKNQELNDGWHLYRYRQLVDQNKCVVDDFNIHGIDWNKDVFIYQEQGIGDWIFHIRMLSLIKDKHQNIWLYLDKRLHSLIKINFPEINLLSSNKFKAEAQNINMASIGRYLINKKEKIRNIELWSLNLNEDKVLIDKKIKIGISWKSQNRDWGDDKSIDLGLFKIFGNKYDLINLQYGDVKNEINEIKLKNKIDVIVNEEIDLFNDIYGLAQLICTCEYIVTISNVTAHIAGTLGKKTLLMLPKNNGKMWYWSKDNNSQSLWYPSVRVIDYNQKDGWEASIREAYEFISKADD